jgi:ATP-dependent DNA helicase RecG
LRQMVLQYLSNAGDEGAKRDSIYEYLKDVLPANKTKEQQLRYVGRLLIELNEEKLIDRIGLKWILTDYNRSV